jgi:hypothetical protein
MSHVHSSFSIITPAVTIERAQRKRQVESRRPRGIIVTAGRLKPVAYEPMSGFAVISPSRLEAGQSATRLIVYVVHVWSSFGGRRTVK